MKGKNIRKYAPISIILISVLCLIGCSGEKEKISDIQKKEAATGIKKPAETQSSEKKEQPYYMKEAQIALELRASEHEAIYDFDGPVIVRVELYSPRSFAMLNHNHYQKKEGQVELQDIKMESSEKPWWQELKLFSVSVENESELNFFANPSPGEDQPDLGKGEVGSLEIIIGEKAFPQPGKYKIKAVWQNNKYGKITSENLLITLVKGHLAESARDLLRVEVLLARKENGPALQLIKKLAEDNPDSYAIRYYLAEAHEKNNNLDEALTQYQHAFTLFPKEKPGEPWEPPIGLGIKIRKLMEKLGKNKK